MSAAGKAEAALLESNRQGILCRKLIPMSWGRRQRLPRFAPFFICLRFNGLAEVYLLCGILLRLGASSSTFLSTFQKRLHRSSLEFSHCDLTKWHRNSPRSPCRIRKQQTKRHDYFQNPRFSPAIPTLAGICKR